MDKKLRFAESISFLYSLEKLGIKMDLDNIRALMDFSGQPQRDLKVLHVAGTNGKGSTSAAIASVLMAMGYRVGLYTSPHIVSFKERIKVDGKEINEQEVALSTDYFRPEVERVHATFFETTTAMMFKYFAESDVDFAVIETGMGGRLDATNVVDPIVSVVTSIGLDHTEVLGDTLEKIAFEKAGIIKPGRPAIVNVHTESLKEVFRKVAHDNGSVLFFVDDVASSSKMRMEIDNSVFDGEVFGRGYPSLKIDLGGKHQVENALTALATLHLVMRSGDDVDDLAIYHGFESIKENTGHRGRLEVISSEPLVILDVAHNPDGINAVLDSLSLLGKRKGILLFGAMRDKDTRSMLEHLRERFETVILTQLQVGRSLDEMELNRISKDINLRSQVFGNSAEALRAALNQVDNDSYILITGSHYLAGEVVPVLEKAAFRLEKS